MIWVLVVFSVGLNLGQIPKDRISGNVYLSQIECEAEIVKLERWLITQNMVLNTICVRAINTVPKVS